MVRKIVYKDDYWHSSNEAILRSSLEGMINEEKKSRK